MAVLALAGVGLLALATVPILVDLEEGVEGFARFTTDGDFCAGFRLGGFAGSSNAFHARLTTEAVARRTFALARARIFLNGSIIDARRSKARQLMR